MKRKKQRELQFRWSRFKLSSYRETLSICRKRGTRLKSKKFIWRMWRHELATTSYDGLLRGFFVHITHVFFSWDVSWDKRENRCGSLNDNKNFFFMRDISWEMSQSQEVLSHRVNTHIQSIFFIYCNARLKVVCECNEKI